MPPAVLRPARPVSRRRPLPAACLPPSPPARAAARRGLGRLLAAALLAPVLPAAAGSLGGAISLDSQLVDRGLAVTARTPVLQGMLSWAPAPDWVLAVSAGAETRAPDRLAQVTAIGTRYWTLSDHWQMRASLLYYRYSVDQGRWHYERTEASLGWTYQDLLSVGVSAFRVPSDTRLYHVADLSLQYPLSDRLAVGAGIGVSDILRRTGYTPTGSDHYRYGHLGLSWRHGGWSARLERIRSSANAPLLPDAPRVAPWVATLARTF